MRFVSIAITRADVSQIDTCNDPDRILPSENQLRQTPREIIDQVFARVPFFMSKRAQNRNYARQRLQIRKKYGLEFYRMLCPVIIFTGANVEWASAQQFIADVGITADLTKRRFEIFNSQGEAVFDKIVSRSQHYPGFRGLSFGSRFVGVGKTGASRVKIDMRRYKANNLSCAGACGIGKARSAVFGSEKGIEFFSQLFGVLPGSFAPHGAFFAPGCREMRKSLLPQGFGTGHYRGKGVHREFLQGLQLFDMQQLAGLSHEISLQVSHGVAAVHIG